MPIKKKNFAQQLLEELIKQKSLEASLPGDKDFLLIFNDELKTKYPEMFADFRLGLSCLPGWYSLIDQLCATIQGYVESELMPQISIIQIKEKFGCLRFYYEGGNPTTCALAQFALKLSTRICESCGASNDTVKRVQRNNWIKHLCPDCAHERGYIAFEVVQ
jgi:hypothetical protein